MNAGHVFYIPISLDSFLRPAWDRLEGEGGVEEGGEGEGEGEGEGGGEEEEEEEQQQEEEL